MNKLANTVVVAKNILLQNEKNAIERLSKGDQTARKDLVMCNLWVAYYAAKQYASDYNKFEDLVSIANLGLVKAMNYFDPDKRVKPSSFAIRCIRNEFLMYFRKNNRHIKEVSLEAPLATNGEGESIYLSDVVSVGDELVWEEIMRKEMRSKINLALNALHAKEKYIMEMRFGLNNNQEHTQAELATILNVSQSCISKLESKVLKKIRNNWDLFTIV